jgi:hypothetical protein
MNVKATLFWLTVAALAMIAVGACGDDDDGGGGESDACAEAAAVEENAISEYCADKTGTCCYCNCWEGSKGLYDQEAYAADQTCECSDPPSSETATCDGVNLDYANNCLADVDQCADWAVQTAEGICDATPI